MWTRGEHLYSDCILVHGVYMYSVTASLHGVYMYSVTASLHGVYMYSVTASLHGVYMYQEFILVQREFREAKFSRILWVSNVLHENSIAVIPQTLLYNKILFRDQSTKCKCLEKISRYNNGTPDVVLFIITLSVLAFTMLYRYFPRDFNICTDYVKLSDTIFIAVV